ncbi:MAG: hypothetical protein AAGF87_00470 [Bacteroidota bacterium]
MLKYFLPLALLAVFSTCAQPESKKENDTVPESTEPDGSENALDETEIFVFDPAEVSEIRVPQGIEVKGDLLFAKAWKDKNGENVLIVSKLGPLDEAEEDVIDEGDQYAELYGEQYIKTEDGYELLWDIYDFERNCPFDLSLDIFPNSTTITDLDEDGVTETTLAYKLGCRSDVSPIEMKVLLLENDVKHGLRGTMSLTDLEEGFEYDYSQIDTTGMSDMDKVYAKIGTYSNEDDFAGQPEVFLEHARELWIRLVNEAMY